MANARSKWKRAACGQTQRGGSVCGALLQNPREQTDDGFIPLPNTPLQFSVAQDCIACQKRFCEPDNRLHSNRFTAAGTQRTSKPRWIHAHWKTERQFSNSCAGKLFFLIHIYTFTSLFICFHKVFHYCFSTLIFQCSSKPIKISNMSKTSCYKYICTFSSWGHNIFVSLWDVSLEAV